LTTPEIDSHSNQRSRWVAATEQQDREKFLYSLPAEHRFHRMQALLYLSDSSTNRKILSTLQLYCSNQGPVLPNDAAITDSPGKAKQFFYALQLNYFNLCPQACQVNMAIALGA
jgi:hypothetical protein